MPEGAFDGAFTICRIAFRNTPYGDGAGWFVGLPGGSQSLDPFLRYFLQFAPEGYAFGINTLIYALTH